MTRHRRGSRRSGPPAPAYRYDLDVEKLERALLEARKAAASGQTAAALTSYDLVLELYRGPFMEEEYEAWAEAPRAHYEKL